MDMDRPDQPAPSTQPGIALGPVPPIKTALKFTVPRKTRPSAPIPPSRSLRARPSDPGPSTQIHQSSPSGLRRPTPKELEHVHKRLGPDAVLERRDEVIKGKEAELKGVMDGHDDAVRERFHLERFISILEGYDPKVSY